jgi:hypothetical protein
MKIEELEEAILSLSAEERAELNRRLHGWADDEWDRQMAEDARQGRLDEIVARAEVDLEAGRWRELP